MSGLFLHGKTVKKIARSSCLRVDAVGIIYFLFLVSKHTAVRKYRLLRDDLSLWSQAQWPSGRSSLEVFHCRGKKPTVNVSGIILWARVPDYIKMGGWGD